MKKLIFFLMLIPPCWMCAQIGIKAGVNFANVTTASSISTSSSTGYHAGLFFGPPSKIFGFRTELVYSKQGYDYKAGANTGNVNLQYIMSSNLMTINITKYVQLQFGAQTAYLINAKADSSNGSGGESNQSSKIMESYNRFDYGFAGGIELHPNSGLLVGGRINVSLGKLYKEVESGQAPSYSGADIKNNVFQVFTGWRFGMHSGKKKSTQLG